MKKLYETPELLKFSLLLSDTTNYGEADELSKGSVPEEDEEEL